MTDKKFAPAMKRAFAEKYLAPMGDYIDAHYKRHGRRLTSIAVIAVYDDGAGRGAEVASLGETCPVELMVMIQALGQHFGATVDVEDSDAEQAAVH